MNSGGRGGHETPRLLPPRGRQSERAVLAIVPSMNSQWHTFTAPDGADIHYRRWLAAPSPRAVVQVVHGAAEHSGRYARFAEALTARGYAVYATDHRGHGRTRLRSGALGDAGPDGWNRMVEDEMALTRLLRAAHPGAKLALFGHSLGSFIAQDCIQREGSLPDALVLSGTAYRPAPPAAVLDHLDTIARADPLGASEPWTARFRDYNAPFAGSTGFEWLSRDDAEVRRYVDDPLCGFAFSNELVRDIFAGFTRMREPARQARVPATLPVLVIQGGKDPVGEDLAATQALLDHYAALGLREVDHRFYPLARHELLNETNRDEVTRDVLGWLGERLDQRR